MQNFKLISLGFVIEVPWSNENEVRFLLREKNVPFSMIGVTLPEDRIEIRVGIQEDENLAPIVVLDKKMRSLRDLWEATSFELERHQANPACVTSEQKGLFRRHCPHYRLSFSPSIFASGM